MGITKSSGQKHEHDKFYTKPHIAESCVSKLDIKSYTDIIEPSAGNGSFLPHLPSHAQAFDISPEHPLILEQDFFQYQTSRKNDRRTLVIGNPPFGQQNSLAVNFFNHAASFADTIAFILPLSFMRKSIQDRLSLSFHLSEIHEIPPHAFLLKNADYHVPCVFQVWDYSESRRIFVPPRRTTHLFDFVKKDNNPDLCIQRVGSKAGQAQENTDKNETSNYFIKLKIDLTPTDFCNMVNGIIFPEINYSVGPRSLNKGELVESVEKEYSRVYENI